MQDVISDSFKLQSNVKKLAEQAQRAIDDISTLNMQNLFLDYTAILTMLLNNFGWETQNLQSVVNSALNGLTHTSVYPPLELYHVLMEIQFTLPPILEFPVANSHLDIPELFRVSSLNVIYVDRTLMFLTHISLLVEIQFNLNHNIPLPIVISNKSIVLIDPETQYLAISVNHEYHFSLTES